MNRIRRLRPSPSMAVAVAALLVALTTGAYAASTVGTNDLKNRAVTAKKLHRNAVRTTKIKNEAVTGAKLEDSVLGSQRFVETANGVGNSAGCQGGELAVVVTDGLGAPADDRFTFQVPGGAPAFGQIRSDGSIRNSSANVSGVTHQAGSGAYCIQFSVSQTQEALEGAVVAMHVN